MNELAQGMGNVSVKVITGSGTTPERAGELAAAIKALCYDMGDGLSLAAVIGALEIAKLEILQGQGE